MNNMLEEDIKQAIAFIKEKGLYRQMNDDYKKYDQVFCFSNENMTGYYDKLNLQGKKILTVAGSGDQAINAIIYGAKEIHCFDINRFTKYEVDLKRASILSLDRDNLLSFFPFDYNYDFLQQAVYYKKIRNFLQYDSMLFWDTLFETFNKENLKQLFRGTDWETSFLMNYIPYMNKDKYIKLQSMLSNHHFPFIESCITKLSNNLKDNKYDLILLSNIYSSTVNEMYPEQLEAFKQLILRLSNNLNPNGEIAYAYFRYYQVRMDWLKNNGHGNLLDIFNESERRVISIDEGDKKTNTAVLMYKKAA